MPVVHSTVVTAKTRGENDNLLERAAYEEGEQETSSSEVNVDPEQSPRTGHDEPSAHQMDVTCSGDSRLGHTRSGVYSCGGSGADLMSSAPDSVSNMRGETAVHQLMTVSGSSAIVGSSNSSSSSMSAVSSSWAAGGKSQMGVVSSSWAGGSQRAAEGGNTGFMSDVPLVLNGYHGLDPNHTDSSGDISSSAPRDWSTAVLGGSAFTSNTSPAARRHATESSEADEACGYAEEFGTKGGGVRDGSGEVGGVSSSVAGGGRFEATEALSGDGTGGDLRRRSSGDGISSTSSMEGCSSWMSPPTLESVCSTLGEGGHGESVCSTLGGGGGGISATPTPERGVVDSAIESSTAPLAGGVFFPDLWVGSYDSVPQSGGSGAVAPEAISSNLTTAEAGSSSSVITSSLTTGATRPQAAAAAGQSSKKKVVLLY